MMQIDKNSPLYPAYLQEGKRLWEEYARHERELGELQKKKDSKDCEEKSVLFRQYCTRLKELQEKYWGSGK